jgi:hypothetical protein
MTRCHPLQSVEAANTKQPNILVILGNGRHGIGHRHLLAPRSLYLFCVNGVPTHLGIHALGRAIIEVGLQSLFSFGPNKVDLPAAAVLVIGLVGASLIAGSRFTPALASVPHLHDICSVPRRVYCKLHFILLLHEFGVNPLTYQGLYTSSDFSLFQSDV